MKTKIKFTSFIPFLGTPAVFDWLKANNTIAPEHELLQTFRSKDPSATSWRSQGLVSCGLLDEEFIYSIEAGVFLMSVQFNERILPGKVRDEFLAERLKQFEDREGRKMNKKDYAVLKEEVEFELLPKAFIRRSQVPVLFFCRQRMVMICTSSAKRAGDAAAMLSGFFTNAGMPETVFYPMDTQNPIVGTLTAIAKTGFITDPDSNFKVGTSAVLRGEGKQTIRIKDKDIEAGDIHKLLMQDYDVHELGMAFDPNGNTDEPLLTFAFNDKGIFKSLKFNDGVAKVEMGHAETAAEQLTSVIWLTARTYRDLVLNLMTEFGGYKTFGDMKREAKQAEKAEREAMKPAKGVDPLNEDDDDESL